MPREYKPWQTRKHKRKAWVVNRDDAAFAARLRAVIMDRGICCAEIERRMGLRSPTSRSGHRIYMWTTGRGMPRLDSLRSLCRVLRVSADWLMGLDQGGADGPRPGRSED